MNKSEGTPFNPNALTPRLRQAGFTLLAGIAFVGCANDKDPQDGSVTIQEMTDCIEIDVTTSSSGVRTRVNENKEVVAEVSSQSAEVVSTDASGCL